MWNIAHNLGGFAAPILAGTAARTFGWSFGLWAPGVIAVVVGVIIVSTLRDSPEDRGFPPVEVKDVPGMYVNSRIILCVTFDV